MSYLVCREIELAQERLSIAIQKGVLSDIAIQIEKHLLRIEVLRNRYTEASCEQVKTDISFEISEEYCEIEVLRCKERKTKHLIEKATDRYIKLSSYVSPPSSPTSFTSSPDASSDH